MRLRAELNFIAFDFDFIHFASLIETIITFTTIATHFRYMALNRAFTAHGSCSASIVERAYLVTRLAFGLELGIDSWLIGFTVRLCLINF